jgi:glycosyltransferase involved in cell wall biosynthesis
MDAESRPDDAGEATLLRLAGVEGQPLLPEIGVVAVVPEPWNLVWQVRQQVLLRLARYFHVVWVEPPRHWRWWKAETGRHVPAVAPVDEHGRFLVYESRLPKFGRPTRLAAWVDSLRLRRARALLVRRRCTAILLYLWRPQFAAIVDLVPFTQRLYHIDDEYSFREDETRLSDQERRLIELVDQVFVVSPGLLAAKGGINPHTAFVPNGVDFHAYATPWPEPIELAAIPRPRIGYTGVVKPQLDWPLLGRLAAARSDWSFVFVGPIQREPRTLAAVAELERRRNVHFLGFKPPQALAAYPQHFDVCIMPYRINHYTNQIYPLKLHEYLASGRPAVGTPIATLTAFTDVVTLAREAEAWLGAIESALTPAANAAEQCAARQAVARRHDWDLLVHQIARIMLERLGAAWVHRLDEALERHGSVADAAGNGSAPPALAGGVDR